MVQLVHAVTAVGFAVPCLEDQGGGRSCSVKPAAMLAAGFC